MHTLIWLYNSVGCLIAFVLVLYSYFWLLYVFHLTLKLVFPMAAYKIFHSDYRRVVSSAEVLVVCFIAAVPSVIGAGLSKYNITTHPPIFCGTDRRYQFFTVAVPILIVACISLNLMLIVLYKLHKVCLYCLSYIYPVKSSCLLSSYIYIAR